MAMKLIIVLAALSSVSVAAPFDNYRDFMMSMYDAFEGTSDELYYNCLTSTDQYAINTALTNLKNVFINAETAALSLQDLFDNTIVLGQKVTDIYGNCRLFVIPYSTMMTINNDWEIMRLRLLFNIGNILADLITVF